MNSNITIQLFSFIISFMFCAASAIASCDCGSTNQASPCTGQSITVTVTAGTPNRGTAVNNVYNWSFNSGGGDARCGQFANGDYWVAPASGQSSVTITGISSTSHPTLITADADIIPESMGLTDGTINDGNYTPSENIITSLPISYSTVTSLVGAIQRNEATEGACESSMVVCVDSYNILSVLTSVPEDAGSTSIRPNITGETKEMLKLSDFDLTRIPSKDYLTGPSVSGVADIKRRWSHSVEVMGVFNSVNASGWSEGGRRYRSHALIDDYGAGAAVAVMSDIISLFSDDLTISEKTPAIAAILTYGHDIYKAVYDPPVGVTRWFGVGATQIAGRFPPAAFFASLLKDTTYKTVIQQAGINGTDLASVGPHELTQIHPGDGTYVWGDIIFGGLEERSYWGNLLVSQCYDGATGTCTTTNGKRTGRDPHGYIDGPPNKPGAGYMPTSLGPQKGLLAAMFMMPNLCDTVNYPALTTYVDRVTNYGLATASDPCVTPDTRESPTGCTPYPSGDGCVYYGVTWGPDPANPGDCIKVATPPYTKVGRFTNLDGDAVGIGYPVSQVSTNWNTIRGSSGSCNSVAIFRRVRAPGGGIIHQPDN